MTLADHQTNLRFRMPEPGSVASKLLPPMDRSPGEQLTHRSYVILVHNSQSFLPAFDFPST